MPIQLLLYTHRKLSRKITELTFIVSRSGPTILHIITKFAVAGKCGKILLCLSGCRWASAMGQYLIYCNWNRPHYANYHDIEAYVFQNKSSNAHIFTYERPALWIISCLTLVHQHSVVRPSIPTETRNEWNYHYRWFKHSRRTFSPIASSNTEHSGGKVV